MTNEAPKKRERNPDLRADNVIFVEFTDRGDTPVDEARERKGRPARNPSLPPLDEQQPGTDKPVA